ncbi:hypothetical protein [Pelagibacterium halotolerans]|nr:hypothetical protein [Pelagibacterium halotolerans]QJR17632.1 hypothetical protein HKM20_03755 [Pelagibacterium halotolerans]SEA84082.1 hypothetical protein SAMN05428936_10960 [Pelagibacterium halotolerans]
MGKAITKTGVELPEFGSQIDALMKRGIDPKKVGREIARESCQVGHRA